MEELKVILPGWETVRCIGSGSSGKVYELKKKDEYGGDYSSALKVITVPSTKKEYDEMKSSMSEFAMRAKLRDKVEEISSEYRLMGSLRGHPNIVNCEDQMIVPHSNDLGWDIYIRMELLTSLPEYVKYNGMPVSEVVRLGTDICSALELCREGDIVHRDIKPQNVFVSRYGSYKLGDFGIAKVIGERSSSDMAGTYSYMAPEIYKGMDYDGRADIYSLGMLLYYLLNEQRGPFLPYDRTPTQEEISTARQRRFDGEALPAPKYGTAALKNLILKACSFSPDERFSDPTAMKQALLSSLVTENKANIGSDDTVREEIPIRPQRQETRPAPPVIEEVKPEKPKAVPRQKTQDAPSENKKNSSHGSNAAIVILAVIVALLCAVIAILIVFGGDRGSEPYTPKHSPAPSETVEPKNEITINTIVLSSPRLVLTAGESALLTVSTIPDTSELTETIELVWKSSDPSIASVDENGNVTGIVEGTATVMAYVRDKMEIFDQCMVVVEKPVVTKLEIATMPTKTVYGPGESLDTAGLSFIAHYNNGEVKTVDDPAEYTVSCNMDGIGSRKAVVSYEGATVEYTVRISLFG